MCPKVKKLLSILPAIGTSALLASPDPGPDPYISPFFFLFFFLLFTGGVPYPGAGILYYVAMNAVLVCVSTLPIIYIKGADAYLFIVSCNIP